MMLHTVLQTMQTLHANSLNVTQYLGQVVLLLTKSLNYDQWHLSIIVAHTTVSVMLCTHTHMTTFVVNFTTPVQEPDFQNFLGLRSS